MRSVIDVEDNCVVVIPEGRLELFTLWILSFFIGRYVTNLAPPFFRSLIFEKEMVNKNE